MNKLMLTMAACGVACLASSASAAPLAVYLDLLQSGGSTLHTGTAQQITAVGGKVSLDLYAKVLNTDGKTSNDGFNALQGAFVGGDASATLVGNITNGGLNSNFAAAIGSQTGNATKDLSGDGGLDLGGLATKSSMAGDFWIASSGTSPYMTAIGTETIGGSSYQVFDLGTVVWTEISGTGSVTLQFIPRNSSGTIKFASDTTTGLNNKSLNGFSDVNVDRSGTSVVVSVPEPATLGLLGLSAAGMLIRRRNHA